MYSQAIAGDEQDHTLFGNRSAAYLALGLYEQAQWDGAKCVKLAPGWAKGYYRLGCVYMALSQWTEAAAVLAKGAELEPSNAEMVRVGQWAASQAALVPACCLSISLRLLAHPALYHPPAQPTTAPAHARNTTEQPPTPTNNTPPPTRRPASWQRRRHAPKRRPRPGARRWTPSGGRWRSSCARRGARTAAWRRSTNSSSP